MPISYVSANQVNQSNLFGQNLDKAESSLSYKYITLLIL